MVFVLTVILTLLFVGCNPKETVNEPPVIPEDFTFSLTWGTCGRSIYNSKTGKLVKEIGATNPDDYTAYYKLTEDDSAYIYELVESLDIYDYPDVYDPQEGMLASSPSMTLILNVCQNGVHKTIKAEDIAIIFESENKKGQMFLSVCKALIDRLTATDEWKAFPDYEFYYD